MSDVSTERPSSLTFLRKNMEIVIAVLLGLVSIATAYASFQSSLYGGNQTQNYTVGVYLSFINYVRTTQMVINGQIYTVKQTSW